MTVSEEVAGYQAAIRELTDALVSTRNALQALYDASDLHPDTTLPLWWPQLDAARVAAGALLEGGGRHA